MTEPTASGPRRAAFAFVFITVLLDMLAIGIIIPVLPKLVESFMGGDTARAADVYGVFGTAWALMQFLFSPVLGALSDRFGRRPIILLSNFGLGLDYILMALAPTLRLAVRRARHLGHHGGEHQHGGRVHRRRHAAGTARGEVRHARRGVRRRLRRRSGARRRCSAASIRACRSGSRRASAWPMRCTDCSCCPSRCRASGAAPFSWRKANPVGALKLLRSHHELWGLAWVTFLSNLAHAALPSVAVLYMGYRYDWDTTRWVCCSRGVGVCSILVQGVLVGPVVKALGERRTILVGLVGRRARLRDPGDGAERRDVRRRRGRHVAVGLDGPGAAERDDASRRVRPSRVSCRARTAACSASATLIGPMLFTQTFATFIGSHRDWHLPGAPFLLSAILLVSSLAVALRVMATRLQSVPAANP